MNRAAASSLVRTALLATALAACAAQRSEVVEREVVVTMPLAADPAHEPWPPPGHESVPRPAPTGETVEFAPDPGGVPVLEFLATIQRRTGAIVLYDEATNQKLRSRLTWVGTWRVPTSRVLDFARSVLFAHNMVLVPLGPQEGVPSYALLDQNNPQVKAHPVFLREQEVLGYADCDGLYVVTVLRLRDIVDSGRARQALSTMTTQTANIGRIQDVPGGRAILVADFAPTVAAMKRVLDEVNRSAVPLAPPPAAAPAPVPAK